MAKDQKTTQPLLWTEEYLKLLSEMDGAIHRSTGAEKKEKWIRYQTLIAAGGYFGLRAKEFLHLTWYDLVGRKETDVYQFKTGRKRKLHFNKDLIRMVEHNYRLANPVNIHHLVLHKVSSPMEAIATRQFNESFEAILKECKVPAENPSSHTLRKTFAYHIWADLYGKTEEGLMVASEMLDHQDIKDTTAYLGISQKKIKETYLRF